MTRTLPSATMRFLIPILGRARFGVYENNQSSTDVAYIGQRSDRVARPVGADHVTAVDSRSDLLTDRHSNSTEANALRIG